MLKEVILPTLGLDIEEAVIEKWLKQEGDGVLQGEPLLLVETEKASTEINAPTSGVLKRIVEPEGATVRVTHVVAYIEADRPAESIALSPPAATAAQEAAGKQGARAAQPKVPAPVVPPAPQPDGRKVRASPAARRAAKDLGVDITRVKGTGPGGRIQGDDVRHFAEEAIRTTASPAEPSCPTAEPVQASVEPAGVSASLPGRLVPLSRKRRVTADRMALSARSVARVTLNMEVDAGELTHLRTRLLPAYEARGLPLSYDAILAKVAATALADHPYLNARWTEKGIYLVEPINVGVAIAVDDGLVAPVIRNADHKKLADISAELAVLLAKAKEDRLTPEEVAGGTFTITNLGMFEVDSFTPIVNPPETAILGMGRILEKPVGRDGQIVLRPMVTLSLSFDHRIVDGAPAAQFLQRLRQLLEEPYLLL